MLGFLPAGTPRLASTPLHALWRSPEIEASLANLASRPSLAADLVVAVGDARFAALTLLDSFDAFERADREAAPAKPARAVRDSLATDLLATAVLAESLRGNRIARRAIDHLRRQRGVVAIAWTASLSGALEADSNDDFAGELVVPRP